MAHDLMVKNCGSVVQFSDLSTAAREWVDANVTLTDYQWLGSTFIVEARFAEELVDALRRAGFDVIDVPSLPQAHSPSDQSAHSSRLNFAAYPSLLHLQGSFERYLYGCPTGDFLRCILENDLFGAVARADHININLIPTICRFVANEMPKASFGSAEKVDRWIIQQRARVDETSSSTI